MIHEERYIKPAASDADGIAQSQQPSAGGQQSLILNGALSNLGTPGVYEVKDSDSPGVGGRKIALRASGLDGGRVFTVIGTGPSGSSQEEDVVAVDTSTVYTTKHFNTVTDIQIDGNPISLVSAGTTDTGGALVSGAVALNRECNHPATELIDGSSGTYSADVEETYDLRTDEEECRWIVSDPGVSADGYLNPHRYANLVRVLVDSYTNGAEFTFIVAQATHL